MKKRFVALLAAFVVLLGAVVLFRSGGAGSALIWKISEGGTWLLPLVVVSSLIDSVNPCAFSILILTIAFLLSLGKARSRIFAIGGSYVLGIFVIYMLIGLGITGTLHLFDTPHFMAKVGATLLILFGLINVVHEFFPSFPLQLRIPHAAHRRIAELMERGSVPAAFLLGAVVGLCEFPCTGGPYLMVLGLLHDKATYFSGFGYLLLYNLVFILPLFLILGIASEGILLEKVKAWQRENRKLMRLGGGLAMVALGTAIFFL